MLDEKRVQVRLISRRAAGQPESAIVLPGMSGIGFNPFGVNQAEGTQAAQQRVDCALDHDQIRIALEMTQDLEAVKPVAPERGQDGELERSFAELDLPFFGIFGRWRARIFHSNILCSAMYMSREI